MDGYVKATRVFFVAGHFNVLQESNKLCDAPAELSWIWLNENQLQNVNYKETTKLRGVLHDDGAGDQIAVVCE